MEKTDSFSLYDVLTFIIPGFILVVFLYSFCRTMDWELQPLASYIPDNSLLNGVIIISGSFLAGFFIHYVNEHNKFFIGGLRTKYNNKEYFSDNPEIAKSINELIKSKYGWNIIDNELIPIERAGGKKYADDIFAIYYNQFFNDKKLRVFNRYQLPFFMFANLTLVLLGIGVIYGVGSFFIVGSNFVANVVFISSCFFFSILSNKVAFTHRKKFIDLMWLSIFAELKGKPNG